MSVRKLSTNSLEVDLKSGIPDDGTWIELAPLTTTGKYQKKKNPRSLAALSETFNEKAKKRLGESKFIERMAVQMDDEYRNLALLLGQRFRLLHESGYSKGKREEKKRIDQEVSILDKRIKEVSDRIQFFKDAGVPEERWVGLGLKNKIGHNTTKRSKGNKSNKRSKTIKRSKKRNYSRKYKKYSKRSRKN